MNENTNSSASLIRIVETDGATHELLREWLTSAGFAVVSRDEPGPTALAIVDVPFTRQGGSDVVERVAAAYPDAPILALSATLFSNVKCGGACARALGVAGVLPKPVTQDTLIATVRNLLLRDRCS